MNKIQFRGKRVSDGTWVYGDLLTQYLHHNGATIVEYGCVCNEVTPDTVGQFTGMYDRSYKKIYEGDILISKYSPLYNVIVEFRSSAFYAGQVLISHNHGSTIEVIGNIHDNPELLDV